MLPWEPGRPLQEPPLPWRPPGTDVELGCRVDVRVFGRGTGILPVGRWKYAVELSEPAETEWTSPAPSGDFWRGRARAEPIRPIVTRPVNRMMLRKRARVVYELEAFHLVADCLLRNWKCVVKIEDEPKEDDEDELESYV